MNSRMINGMRMFFLALFGFVTILQAQDSDSGPAGRIDVSRYEIRIEVDPERAHLRGEAWVTFTALEDALTLPFRLNSRLALVGITDEKERFSSRYVDFGSDKFRLRGEDPFKAGNEYRLRFNFEGTLETEQYAFVETPERSPAFITREGALLLSQGNWFPNHDLPIDTASVQMSVTVPLGFSVVGPGSMSPIETEGIRETFTWSSPSELSDVPLVVARFLRERFEGKPPFTAFVRESSDLDLKPLMEEIRRVLDFYSAEYGPLPVQELTLAQAGKVELSEAGSLGLVLLEDAIVGALAVPKMELARRLALQWWGYTTHFKADHDAWLRDGFATYSAMRYLEANDDEAFKIALARQAVEALKYEDRSPVSDGLRLDPGTPQYQSIVASKGGWVLYMLSQLTGKPKFDSLLRDWYQSIKGRAATTAGFKQFVEGKTGQDYGWFFLQWIESVGVPEFQVDYKVFKRKDGSFRIQGQIKQDLDLFRMPVELEIQTKGKKEHETLQVNGRQTSFNFLTETMPLKISFDPAGKILLDSEAMRVRVHIAMGDEFQRQGEYVAAITEYEKAKGEDPRSSLVHYRLGETYFAQASYNLSANNFRDALNGDLEPEWTETWSHIHLGKIYDVLGQRQRAMAEYQKAINTKIDYNNAQREAKKYFKSPFTKPSHVIN